MQCSVWEKLELIPFADLPIILKKSMRDGVSYFPKRYSKISNEYLKPYDPKQESKHIDT